MFMAIII